jgi:hypothetical protein
LLDLEIFDRAGHRDQFILRESSKMSRHSFLRRSVAVAAATVLLVAFLPRQADAALFAYDQFSVGPGGYLIGDDSTGVNVLGGQNPAIGPTAFYNGPWIQSGGDAQAVTNGSLLYPLFPNGGGHVTDSVQFSCCSFGRTGREITDGLGGGRTPRTIYQSFLIDFGSQGTDDPLQFGKRGYEMWNGGIGDSFKALDLFVNHFSGDNELTLSLTTASGTQSQKVNGGGLTLDVLFGVHLVVLKFDFDPANADVVSLFLDPTDSIEANYLPAAQIAIATSDLFITHQGTISNFTFSGAGHVPGAFDEVRWGETFADVTPFLTPQPVPEPATLGILALGLVGVAVLRRR